MARIKITKKMTAKQAEKAIKRLDDEEKRVSLVNKAYAKKEKVERMKK
ncbi:MULTISPECIES: hypothetical protein [Flectobacillus]|uniref:30S ribosomal protein S21 n=1 Tax=Flectobacillus rivi TaxID=2984209 RepID=A0ABT6Z0H3_9BACT|nr:hypothetical protein [Flectobacillus rivi]MDI9874640.1 hypothetical protein [Flectobacillus rivi]